MSSTSKSFSDYGLESSPAEIAVGDHVPPLRRSVSRLQSTLYCAAIRFAHQVHFDDDLCRREGWRGAIVPGFLMGNWCIEGVSRMLGPRSVVRSVSFRMTSVAYLDSPLEITGEVTDVVKDEQSGLVVVTCAMRVTDGDDAVVTKGRVSVAVPI